MIKWFAFGRGKEARKPFSGCFTAYFNHEQFSLAAIDRGKRQDWAQWPQVTLMIERLWRKACWPQWALTLQQVCPDPKARRKQRCARARLRFHRTRQLVQASRERNLIRERTRTGLKRLPRVGAKVVERKSSKLKTQNNPCFVKRPRRFLCRK